MNVKHFLRDEIASLELQIKEKKRQLDRIVKNCPHKWSAIVADHIYMEGYTCPGDPVGTMGVDWRGPTYIEPVTIKRWKRTCMQCGEIQYTNKTTQLVTESPMFD